MGSQVIDKTATTSAEPSVVYALLRDGASWPEWSPLGSFELERAAEGEPEGLGAVRVFRTGRVTNREEIVELVPNRRFSYALLSDLAIRGYRADVELEPADGGTLIRWHSSFDPKVPGTGWLYRRQMTGFIEQTVEGLAARAAEIARGQARA
jgi:Polyketide cyclase / dehydrase and lipid transport